MTGVPQQIGRNLRKHLDFKSIRGVVLLASLMLTAGATSSLLSSSAASADEGDQLSSLCALIDVDEVVREATTDYVARNSEYPDRILLHEETHLKMYSYYAYIDVSEINIIHEYSLEPCTIFKEVIVSDVLDSPIGGVYAIHAEFSEHDSTPLICIGPIIRRNSPSFLGTIRIPYTDVDGWLINEIPCYLADGELHGFRKLLP